MSILVLSGPVGAGKTTVARELIAHAPEGTAYIEGDAFWPFIVEPRKGQSRQASFLMTMRAMFAAAWHYHRDDYRVLLDFSVPPGFLPGARKLLRDTPFHFVVLLPPVGVCAARAAARAEGKIADYARYRDFYADFDVDEPFVIREQVSAEDMADRIRAENVSGSSVVWTSGTSDLAEIAVSANAHGRRDTPPVSAAGPPPIGRNLTIIGHPVSAIRGPNARSTSQKGQSITISNTLMWHGQTRRPPSRHAKPSYEGRYRWIVTWTRSHTSSLAKRILAHS